MTRIPDTMRAMVLEQPGGRLALRQRQVPEPEGGQLLLRVLACGVCRTDLHLVDDELPSPSIPVIPGHEIVGTVVERGPGVDCFNLGDRVGVPWLGWTCGTCPSCRQGRENLCDTARFTGYTLDGGFAEYAAADQRYCFAIPEDFADAEAAPLLCAGLIGYRSLRLAGAGVRRLGLYGFGAAAHIVAQIARHQGCSVFAFTRPGDARAQSFARRLGAEWAGASDEQPPEPLDAALIFAPVGALVPAALKSVVKGGTVVCGGIHMSDIPSFPYSLLWEERELRSVANLERRDGDELLAIAPQVPVRTQVETMPLEKANDALDRLRTGDVEGALVLIP